MEEQIFGAVTALAGALIGGAMPLIVSLVQERSQRRARAEILARAIAGEISAVLEILERRGLIKELHDAASMTKENPPVFRWRVSREYFPVTRSSITDFGILPAGLTHMVPRLLTAFNAALEDFDDMYEGKWDDAEAARLRVLYRDLAALLEMGHSVGEEIIKTVNARYPPAH